MYFSGLGLLFFLRFNVEIFALIFWELLVLNFLGMEKQGLEVRI